MLEVNLEDVWYKYQNSEWVLKGVNASFTTGLNLILGPNGSGKSTLLKIIIGYLKPQRGKVIINGEEVSLKKLKNRAIFVPSNHLLYLTGPRVRDESINLPSNLLDRRILELSEGEGKLTAIVSALEKDREIIVLDEPTVGLDRYWRTKIMDALREFGKSKLIIVSSNDLRILEYFDRIYILSEGKILAEGSLNDLVKRQDIWKFGMPAIIELAKVLGLDLKVGLEEVYKYIREVCTK